MEHLYTLVELHLVKVYLLVRKILEIRVKFSVLGSSGNTDIQGTLDVAGASEFNGTVDVDADFAVRNGTTDKFFVDNVTGNTVIEGSLNVNGVTDIDADFAVRNGTTDKFFVNNVTGNTNIEGTSDC